MDVRRMLGMLSVLGRLVARQYGQRDMVIQGYTRRRGQMSVHM